MHWRSGSRLTYDAMCDFARLDHPVHQVLPFVETSRKKLFPQHIIRKLLIVIVQRQTKNLNWIHCHHLVKSTSKMLYHCSLTTCSSCALQLLIPVVVQPYRFTSTMFSCSKSKLLSSNCYQSIDPGWMNNEWVGWPVDVPGNEPRMSDCASDILTTTLHWTRKL